ncbi:MAG: PAS domain S-box protein, partial [Candidatus Electrothrix sp. AR4]|nr:PAS domain S-box protein [Candidatus Electrothrix sp. AR4]
MTDCVDGMVTSIDPVSGRVTVYILPDPSVSFLSQRTSMKGFYVTLSRGDDGKYPGLWGQALNSLQGFYLDFVSPHDQSTGIPPGPEPHKNYLNVPVIIDKKPVGQIALANKQKNFTRHDLLAIERLAALFALFIQRKHMEEAVNRSEVKYRSLFDDALDMIHIIDEDEKIINVNPVELQTMGYTKEEFIGKSLLEIVHPDFQQKTAIVLEQIFTRGGSIKNYETALISKIGEQIDVEVSAVPQLDMGKVVSVRAIMRNITDRKKEELEKKNLEAQLRQSHKMEAIGTLAGGIAHDFNNILGPILGYTELALDVLPDDNQTRPWLQEVLHASHRARELVRQILTISRKTDQELQPIRIQIIIKETLKLLRSSIPSN